MTQYYLFTKMAGTGTDCWLLNQSYEVAILPRGPQGPMIQRLFEPGIAFNCLACPDTSYTATGQYLSLIMADLRYLR